MGDWPEWTRNGYPPHNHSENAEGNGTYDAVWRNPEDTQYYGQQSNESYYNNQQYVGFNDFLTQFQQKHPYAPGAGSYNTSGSYSSQANEQSSAVSNAGTSSARPYFQDSDRDASVSFAQYNDTAIAKFNSPQIANNTYDNTTYFNGENSKYQNSNLTVTAMEFVPKNVKDSKKNPPPDTINAENARKVNENHSARLEENGGSLFQNNETAVAGGSTAREGSSRHYDSSERSKSKNNLNTSSNSNNTRITRNGYESKPKQNYNDRNARENYNGRTKNVYNSYQHQNASQQNQNNSYQNQRKSGDVRNLVWENSSLKRETTRDGNISRQSADAGSIQSSPASPMRPGKYQKDKFIPKNSYRQEIKYSEANRKENPEMTQRERLTQQLDRGELECLVCCERVKQIDQIWSCGNCHHVMHLKCIRKWATSSIVENQWRCPACQNESSSVPYEYRCFCGRVRSPEWRRGYAPAHACGEQCSRTRPAPCRHPCPLPCHAGPCPPCEATVQKKCGCGAETRSVRCSSTAAQECGRSCGRALNCGTHFCQQSCHEGDCQKCEENVKQVCHCPAGAERSVACDGESASAGAWSCSADCGRILECGHHVCKLVCHAPPCHACELLPEAVLTCPCGKMSLTEAEVVRKSCVDPIPLCGNICTKPLTCGPVGDRHFCKVECHDGPCPDCPDKTLVKCRCGHTSQDITCVDLPQRIDNVRCQKKCNKRLSCSRHRCRELCCAQTTHRCPLTCGHSLTCGQHRCKQPCHTGYCQPCSQVSFEELRCRCGGAVRFPPVACGTRPPPCDRDCSVARACGHAPHHSCHTGECPPCVLLTTKCCYGGHEERKTIPCHQKKFSCGLPCGRPLPCGKHNCIKTCHSGECSSSLCVQPCTEARPACGHACGAACRSPGGAAHACPAPGPCRATVRATCQCGRRTADRLCCDNAKDYSKWMSGVLASKMQDVQLGDAVDLSAVVIRPGANLKTLECNEECRVEERNRQLAIALQIRNPDVGQKLAPRYSDFMRGWAARDASFALNIHDQLTQLVQRAKKSKQRTRAHSFASMNRQKRQFVHEMCEHFGCESVAYDEEPNRNVVATADRDKSWLPAMSILEVLEREEGKRRVPGPVMSRASTAPAKPGSKPKSTTGWATLTSSYGNAWGARSQGALAAPTCKPTATASTSTLANTIAPKKPPPIDYFDNPPDNY